jgi:hypothetical protein
METMLKLSKEEKEEAIRKLENLKGCLKGKIRIGHEEAREIAFRKAAARHGIN